MADPQLATAQSQDARLQRARMAALFNVARPAYFATFVNACLLLLVLWEAFPAALLLSWFGVLTALTLARIVLHRAYLRDTGRYAPRRWESLFTLGAVAAGVLWTYPPAVFLPMSDPLLQMAVIFVVGGTIIGAAGVYAPSPAAFYGFCVLPFLAVVVQLAAQAGRTYALLALMVAVFGAVMVRVYRDIHGSILRTLRTQIENEELVGRLARSEGQLRDAIESFPEGIAVFDAHDRLVVCNEIYASVYGGGQTAAELPEVPYAVIAQNALAAEVIPPAYAARHVQWLEERLARRRSGVGRLRHYQLRDGRSLQGLFVRSRAGGIVSMFTDITELRRAQDAYNQVLSNSEATYRNLVETSNDLIWSVDAEGRWTYLSPAALRRIYHCEPAEMLGCAFSEQLAQEVSERDIAVFGRILRGESVFDYQTRHVRRDGCYIDLSFNAVPTRDTAGAVTGATGTARDVTAEKGAAAALYENVEKLRLAVDAAELQYWEWDRSTGSMQFGRSPGASQLAADRISFDLWLQRVHEEDRERCSAASLATQQRGEPYRIDFRILDASGEVHWIHSRGKAIMDANGEIARVIGVAQDITERKRQEEETRFLAFHDTLTGLPNRRLLDDRLRQAVFLSQRRDTRVALMVVDLDRFKQVNDALGHSAGDVVLREAAHRITGCLRKADTLARHGGDEFVVVIPDLKLDADCQVVAEKILRALEPVFQVDGREFSIGASIGVSLFPTDAGDGEALLRNADAAMYRAKQLGRNNYRFYGR